MPGSGFIARIGLTVGYIWDGRSLFFLAKRIWFAGTESIDSTCKIVEPPLLAELHRGLLFTAFIVFL